MHSCCQFCLLWLWIIGHIGLNEKKENHKFLLELFWLLQHAALELICYYLAISMLGSKMAPSKQDRWLPNCSALDFTILEVEIRAGKIGQKWEWKKKTDVFTDSRVFTFTYWFFIILRHEWVWSETICLLWITNIKKNESDEDLWQSEITERYQKRLSRTASQRGQSGREKAQREGIGVRGDEGQAGLPDPCRLPCGG